MHYGKDGTLEKARNGASIAPKQRKGHSWTTAADERALLDPLCLCRLRFVPSPGPLDLDGLPPAWFTGPTGVKFCAIGCDDAGAVAELYRNPMLTRAGAVRISRTKEVSGIIMLRGRASGSAIRGSCPLAAGSTGERIFINARGSDAEISLRSESGLSVEGGGSSSQSNASQSTSSATREGVPASYLSKY